MLSFFREIASNMLTASKKKESDSMVEVLSAMDPIEIVSLLMHVADVRLGFALEGIDLTNPFKVVADEPKAADKMFFALMKLKREKDYARGNGVAVWLFTLRGATNPHLRGSARAIWAQLARAYPLVEGTAIGMPADLNRQQMLELTVAPRGFVESP